MPDVGDSRTATLTVSNGDGTTAAVLVVTRPDLTTDTPVVTGSGGGTTWTATVALPQAGWYKLVWTVTGTGAGIEPQFLYANAMPPVPGEDPLVCTLEQFKSWLKFGTATDKDDKLYLALASATDWVRWRISGPLKVTTFTERLFTNGGFLQQRKHPLATVTSITPQDGTALPSTSYIVDTDNSQIQLRYGSYGWHTVVYTAGMSQVSHRIRLAGQETARHLWMIQNGSSGRGFPGDDGVPTPLGFAVPRRAEELLSADPDDNLMPGFA